MVSRFSELIVDCHDTGRVEIAPAKPTVEALRAGPIPTPIVFVTSPRPRRSRIAFTST